MQQAGEAVDPEANGPLADAPGGAWGAVAGGCTGCGACVKQCGFLQQVGDPGRVARSFDPSRAADRGLPFACSLCGLCTALCPEGLDPAAAFLELRRDVATHRGRPEAAGHRRLRAYEARGTSPRYSHYALPEGCDTVLFPGCALAGTRAAAVFDLFQYLKTAIPALGVVLDCCGKSSHDLGHQDRFEALFGELREYLLGQGVRRVLVGCPNCLKTFRSYGAGLQTTTVYEVLAAAGAPAVRGVQGPPVTVHDPCTGRSEPALQRAARQLLREAGLTLEEMPSSGRRTLCCGEGGAVGDRVPGLARAWGERRVRQARGRTMVTYCAGCVRQLSRRASTRHVLDVLFGPPTAARAPFTCWHRLRLKRRLRRALPAPVTRERPAAVGGPAPRSPLLWPLFLLESLVAALAAVF